ncbi:MAG: hypothetical protein ABIQ93_10880 [Saprospiraceae bacterium]
MPELPLYIPITFTLAVATAVYCFYRASHSRLLLFITLGWLGLQAALALTGFYINERTTPPHFLLLIAPVVLPILATFRFKKGRRFLDALDLRWLTLLHTARLPMDLVLYWLYQAEEVPWKITFAGCNFDILIGLTAPLVAWLAFGPKGTLRYPKWLLAWNLVGLALLLILATLAIASLPTALQSLSFQRPLVGILYFPYNWMPCGIFPLVFLAQLVGLRRLSIKKNLNPEHSLG